MSNEEKKTPTVGDLLEFLADAFQGLTEANAEVDRVVAQFDRDVGFIVSVHLSANGLDRSFQVSFHDDWTKGTAQGLVEDMRKNGLGDESVSESVLGRTRRIARRGEK